MRFRIEVRRGGEPVFQHDYDAADRDVLVQFPGGTLGDTMGWFPYAEKFRQRTVPADLRHGRTLIPLFRDAYPDIDFVTHEQVRAGAVLCQLLLGLFFDDDDCIQQPCDFRLVGLHRTAGYILGVDPHRSAAAAGVCRRRAADRRTLCLHRRAEHQPVQVLEQSRRLARDRRAS